MSFLDRFKPQPKWRHTDPAVRAGAVSGMPDDEEHSEVLKELAQADEDVRVRRAAIARVQDVALLARLARSEADGDLRRQLTDRLVAIATSPADTDGDAALALDGLDDPKQLSTVAKSSPHDTVRAAALGRVHDAKALGSIARHAADPQTALDAVARISDASELLNVALKTDHRDAGIAALEKHLEAAATEAAAARETLDAVAARAKNKSVSKRARAILQMIEENEAARRLALEHWQQRVAAILARVEAIAAEPSIAGAEREIDQAETDWRDVAAEGTFELDPDTAARFGSLIEAARGGIAAYQQAEAERRATAERDGATRSAWIALCARVENAPAEDALDEVAKARAEWEGLPAPSSREPDDERLQARFDEACRRAAERHENRQQVQQIHARLEELSLEAERVSAAEPDPQEAWSALQHEWAVLSAKADPPDPAIAARWDAADARVRQRAEARRAAAERAEKQQVLRIEQLIDRATRRAAAEDLTLREADRILRELRAAFEAPLGVSEREQQGLLDRLKAAQAALAPKLHDLREMDEWKRFANAAVQEELIAKTEALRAKYGFDTPEGVKPADLEKVARELHEIQERWKQAADAPRAQAQVLWHRYRQAADPVQAKVREFFAQRNEERKRNLERKLALIEQAEALAQSSDWIRTADELKRLQAEWQAIGPVPRQDMRATWKRFREACDSFFTRRNADMAQRKETWSANLAKKEALCARAEELAVSTDWDKAASEIRRLQSEWKTVGPVRRQKSELLWQRFRSACDTFFDRYKRRDQIDLEAKQADREALVTELESLVPAERGDAADATLAEADSGSTAPVRAPMEKGALLEHARSLRNRWNQSTPLVRHGADPLSARFMRAIERLLTAYPEAFRGTELDVDANRQKMEKLCERVEGLLNDAGAAGPASSSQALAAMLREALAANTIGGRAGEESKWRAMAEDVRNAQAAWSRLGPVPGDAGRQLGDRFHRACSRFFDQFRRHVPQQEPAARRGKPVGAR